MDGEVARDRRAAGGEGLEDEHPVGAGQPGAAQVLPYVHASEAEPRRLPQDVDGEVLVLVPAHGVRGQVFLGEVECRLDDRELVVAEQGGHGSHPMVGIVKLAPSRIPEAGQREVTVLVRV